MTEVTEAAAAAEPAPLSADSTTPSARPTSPQGRIAMTEVTEAAAAAEPAPLSADSTTPSARPTSRPRPAEPHIELHGVHVSYPGAPNEALAGIDLQIPAGQYVCILGGNGSGKSTLLQLMNALALPSAGEVRVFRARARSACSA